MSGHYYVFIIINGGCLNLPLFKLWTDRYGKNIHHGRREKSRWLFMGRGEKYEWLKIWGSVPIKQTCLKLVEMNHFPFIFTLKLKFCAWEAFFIVLFLFPWSRARTVNKQVQYGFLFLGKWILKICASRPFSNSHGWTGSSMKWRLRRANLFKRKLICPH